MNMMISDRAEKALRRLPKFDQIAAAEKIRSLARLPIPNEEKLSGFSHIYRVRVGDYRIVYRRTTDEIYIILIGHRRDVYRMVSELLR